MHKLNSEDGTGIPPSGSIDLAVLWGDGWPRHLGVLFDGLSLFGVSVLITFTLSGVPRYHCIIVRFQLRECLIVFV